MLELRVMVNVTVMIRVRVIARDALYETPGYVKVRIRMS